MSEAVQACAAPAAVNSPMGAVVVVPAPVCLQAKTVEVLVVMSTHSQCQPWDAVGKPIVPVDAAPPVPTLMVNDCGPLGFTIDGEVPKPELMVGAAPKLVTPVVSLCKSPALPLGALVGHLKPQVPAVSCADTLTTPLVLPQ